MRQSNFAKWVAAFMLAIALAPTTASAQEADTLSISGTFRGVDYIVHSGGIEYPGMLGADLAEVYDNGYEHAWTLTLYGVSNSHDHFYWEWNDEWSSGYHEQYITRVHATSFDFEFFGPDADILYSVVSQQLTAGSLSGGAVLELSNGYYNSNLPEESGPYSSFQLGLTSSAGVSFSSNAWLSYSLFSADEYGYPLVEPQRVEASASYITDVRPGNAGELFSVNDLVDIGSSVPPVLPPPPPPPPTLSIADASARKETKARAAWT